MRTAACDGAGDTFTLIGRLKDAIGTAHVLTEQAYTLR